jgi:hypothetical protein
MKRRQILIIIAALTIAAILLGAFKSSLPVVQYLGNTTGVLLGFVLGIWWQETERERIRKEQEAEKRQMHQTKVERFWNEYKAFLLELEYKVDRLKNQIIQRDGIYDTIFELRLPLPEASHFERQASELDLEKTVRLEIENITGQIRVLDEYIELGTEKLRSWHPNFRPLVDNLWVRIRDLNVKHSGKTAI